MHASNFTHNFSVNRNFEGTCPSCPLASGTSERPHRANSYFGRDFDLDFFYRKFSEKKKKKNQNEADTANHTLIYS